MAVLRETPPVGGALHLGSQQLPEPEREGYAMSTVGKTRKRPKTGGRTAGTPNKVTADFRATVQKLLDDNAENVGRWLTLVADGDGTDDGKPDPGKALDMLAKLAEYAAPKLARTEHTGEGGGAVKQSLTVSFVTP